MEIRKRQWNKIINHTLYVTALLLFSQLSLSYVDQSISMDELQHAFTSALIAGGMAFTLAFGAETGEKKHNPKATFLTGMLLIGFRPYRGPLRWHMVS